MTPWVLMLRGVNVGGHNKLPMAEFRVTLSDLGLSGVATYIQSGNAVFAADCDREALHKKIATSLEARFGITPDILLLRVDTLRTAIEENPFPEAAKDPKTLHLYFLADRVDRADLGGLAALATAGEAFHLNDRVFYLYTPNGYGRSKLADAVQRQITVPMTARNLRSCRAILSLAEKV